MVVEVRNKCWMQGDHKASPLLLLWMGWLVTVKSSGRGL